jgi:hypothetical protein
MGIFGCPKTQDHFDTRECFHYGCLREGAVKLSWYGKERSNHGLLEIMHAGKWGTICDDSTNVTS